ncbi:hypothetical protein IAD21_02495 [Abditibacteriota bacterium]|nr:hypothetical protein IAD21_02495 [Abditibacteriota bacterium]
MKPYSYSILRYSQDPTSGEAVNVGVLLYSYEQGQATLQVDDNYGHLAELYRGFCKDDFALMLESQLLHSTDLFTGDGRRRRGARQYHFYWLRFRIAQICYTELSEVYLPPQKRPSLVTTSSPQ